MKVLFVGAYDTPDFGGINTYMLRLSQKLSEKGVECLIIRQSSRNYELDIEGIRFINLAVNGPRAMGLFFFLKATNYIIKNRIKADVVCFQSCIFNNVISKRLNKYGYKVCCIQHSFAIDNPKNGFIIGSLILFGERLSSIGKVNILTVSEHNAELIKRRLNKNASIVRCGVNIPNGQSYNSDLIYNYGLTPDNYFLTISRIDQVKNLDLLIKAYRKYKGDKKLVIGGNIDNAYGHRLELLADGDERVVFTGSVVGEEKDALLRNCFAYILVSSSEGFPISLLEAMAFGKRCITSDIAPIREALGNHLENMCRVGVVEDITTQLNRISNDTQREQREKEIFQRVSNVFTWDAAANAFLSYIHDLL